jgi:hypothetical protein
VALALFLFLCSSPRKAALIHSTCASKKKGCHTEPVVNEIQYLLVN